MIAHLKGTIIEMDEKSVTLDVHDVGYKVIVPGGTSVNLRINDVISLLIHTHVKEDQIALFGFKNREDLKIFELLLSVSGVGPKTAMYIISAMSTPQIIKSIQQAKIQDFTKISGIGKKAAQKIVVDLQPKLGRISELDFTDAKSDKDLIEALKNLGFTTKEAVEMSNGVGETLSLEEKLKLSLRTNEKTKRK